MECDICGDNLDEAGPLGMVKCPKCGLAPMCVYCAKIHTCPVVGGKEEIKRE